MSVLKSNFWQDCQEDVRCVLHRDPAAQSVLEVWLCYPGFHALLLHRLAHGCWVRQWRLLGRWISHLSRWLTGIEIHPGATIGRRVFIDHGMGVVIGEMAEIHDDCTIYQGVTLGGTALVRGAKRHPTLEAGVIIGANACVLGGFTVGAGARVGSGAVVTKPVPAGATVVGNPGRIIEATPAVTESPVVAAQTNGFPQEAVLSPHTASDSGQPSAAPLVFEQEPATPPSVTTQKAASEAVDMQAFSAYGIASTDDPMSVAVHKLAAATERQEHQIALIWQCLQAMQARQEQCTSDDLPADAQRHEQFVQDEIKRLLK